MTVSEVIRELNKYHPGIEVRFADDGNPGGDYESRIHNIERRFDEPDYDYVLLS